ncbi:unnamed protein product [Owenia fusiformis]|uniref:Uncharacterized protein n=1 Tax=Owenia fusiformis TaxID=6347 RepID=A0A8S4NN73_OWEFU|nr:unnamed protein product [Owenia fusiformis]
MGKAGIILLVELAVYITGVVSDDGYIGQWANEDCAENPMGILCPQLEQGQGCGICKRATMIREMSGNCVGELECTCTHYKSQPIAGTNGEEITARCGNYGHAEYDDHHDHL